MEIYRIVVVNHKDEIVGITVDGVEHVTSFTEIQPSLEMVTGVDGAYIEGVGYADGGLISILNIEQVLRQ
ncbi:MULTISPECIES: chemotaxis protein CheW [unclassified Paenibacillus]|uniref:chemotaxis protein CheW n=1 Tax=Paenibacillus sp. PvP091 TaxID=2806590 RepID=UPI001AE94F3B